MDVAWASSALSSSSFVMLRGEKMCEVEVRYVDVDAGSRVIGIEREYLIDAE
jgi:hypothetical protein